ncbi:MAG: FHA domain-containing protein [Gemmatimonadaceae bacterium]|nr:FHA domain-containing protein [Gemmatimonadaceae bacterium]
MSGGLGEPLPVDPDETTEQLTRPALAVDVVLRDIRSSNIFSATAARVRVGRSTECEIVIPVQATEGVSRVHCEFGIDSFGSVVLLDAGSTNGTLLNGARVTAPTRVQAQQAIALGDQGPTLMIESVGLTRQPEG